MHCQRCQKSLRSGEGVKCADCESRFHAKCVSTKSLEGGDRGYQWQCAVCQQPAGSSQEVHSTLQRVFEKLELVSKVQLPKLASDLLLLKSTADRITKQNEDILEKIGKIQSDPTVDRDAHSTRQPSRRRRNRSNIDEVDEVPMLSEKCRYRTRRRSYHLYNVFLLVNRKLRRTRTPRNKSPR